MAREIKETPILKGSDAERFEKAIKENESKSVSADDYKRAKEIYSSVTLK